MGVVRLHLFAVSSKKRGISAHKLLIYCFWRTDYVKPTIVFWGNKSAPVMEEEVFAPLVHVRTFDTLEEAIAINNSVRQGLSSALFTSWVFYSSIGKRGGAARKLAEVANE